MSNVPSYARLVDISTALSKQGVVSVLGVVVDVFLTPRQSRGTSYCTVFTIKDTNIDNGHTWDGLKVKYFRDNESQIPHVKEGDVILLRNIRVKTIYQEVLAVAAQTQTISWALYPLDPDPNSRAEPTCGPTPFEPSFTEKRLALSLLGKSLEIKGFRVSTVKPVAPQSQTRSVSASKPEISVPECFTLMQDAKYKTYVDLLVEVVKVYPHGIDHALMYVTDYTTNRHLPDYESDNENGQEGDDYGYLRQNRKIWAGPSGQMSLAVTAWEPHCFFVRDRVNEGDLVYMRNVLIRPNKFNTGMEAIIQTGNKYFQNHGKIRLVNAKSDHRAKELLQRKEEYLSKHPLKRKHARDDEPATRPKKLNRQQKQKAEAKNEEGQTSISLRKRIDPNPHIVAAYGSCSDRPIEDIIANESHENVSPDGIKYRFPFQNLCYRSIVRIVDFFPHTLEDFAVPERQDGGSLSDDERQYITGETFNRWEWRFCLLIENASAPPQGQSRERMKLFVSDAEAVHLLNLDASDLRKKPNDLARLREKLFILWGDLEEQKRKAAGQSLQAPQDSKAISSRPFTCCIKEYGVKCSHRFAADAGYMKKSDEEDSSCSHDGCLGWERRFAMFRTKIN